MRRSEEGRILDETSLSALISRNQQRAEDVLYIDVAGHLVMEDSASRDAAHVLLNDTTLVR